MAVNPGSDASQTLLIDRHGRIKVELACAYCGYDLKHLRRTQRCPECNRRISRTLRLWRLSRLGDPLIVELKTAATFLTAGSGLASIGATLLILGSCAGAVGLGAGVLFSSLGTLAFATRVAAILSTSPNHRVPMRFVALTVLTLICGVLAMVGMLDARSPMMFVSLLGSLFALALLHAASAFLGIELGKRFRQPAIQRWATISFGLAFAAGLFQLAMLTVLVNNRVDSFVLIHVFGDLVQLLFWVGPLTTGISMCAAAGMGWSVRRWCNKAMALHRGESARA